MSTWIDFEKIKREADFAAVLAHYGLAVPAGRRRLKLPCPFHEDRRPSLSVDLEGGVFHCFGCAASGNVLAFVERMERRAGRRCGAYQAARRVAEVCGLEGIEAARPPRRARSPVAARSGAETTREPSRAPAPRSGAPAGPQDPSEEPGEVNPPLPFTLKLDPDHPYLRGRGLSPELVAEFGLGYCARGLMRGRVCVPIHDDAGELVAYAGRWAGPDETIPEGEDRYKLPPGFEKQRVLFNLHRVIAGHVVLVEGFFGVFRLHALGIPAVALMGCALSEPHVELLEGAGVRHLTLLLDGDEPGRQAAAAIMGRLARTAFLARALVLPEGAQPDTVPAPYLRDLLGLRL